jgi:hypothetical protein
VIAAARWSIPSLVTIRSPEQSVLSTAIYFPYLSVKAALKSYVEFYRSILPYEDSFVIGEFTDITSRYDQVIRRINRAFGCDFVEYRNSADSDDIVFSVINQGDEHSPTNPLVTSFYSGNLTYGRLCELLRRDFNVRLDARSPAHQPTVSATGGPHDVGSRR